MENSLSRLHQLRYNVFLYSLSRYLSAGAENQSSCVQRVTEYSSIPGLILNKKLGLIYNVK